ncbi:DUF2179 domain-containing protein [bacterium]|nr:DUF2179 domain-containing protein [bacterium]
MLESGLFRWVILPLLIFFARVLDVSLGTVRIMFVSRGDRLVAPLLGFFEVFIWVTAIGQIMKHMDNVFYYMVYAGGFAAGNYIGITIEDKLAMGKLAVQIITKQDASRLTALLRKHNFGTTVVPAKGKNGAVDILFTVINRSDIQKTVELIETCNPGAFYTIEDTRNVNAGVFPKQKTWKRMLRTRRRHLQRKWRRMRKGK